uniref:Chromosome 1 open reading frame 105 n=2 Tax=Myotis lucifugus TaxID=59463 RepID=G1PDN8_MYOLU
FLSMSLQASVPKFDRIPWLCEASLRNKPLVLSLPKRYPHGSATSLNSWRKDVNSPNTFQVPNGLSKARRNQRGPMLGRNQQLCSTCQEVRMVQPRMMMIPNDLKHSFENCMSHRMKSLQPPKAQTEPRCSPDDISTESIHYRLPLLGPRAGAFHELLSDSYKALRGIQLSASPRKEPTGKTVRQ